MKLQRSLGCQLMCKLQTLWQRKELDHLRSLVLYQSLRRPQFDKFMLSFFFRKAYDTHLKGKEKYNTFHLCKLDWGVMRILFFLFFFSVIYNYNNKKTPNDLLSNWNFKIGCKNKWKFLVKICPNSFLDSWFGLEFLWSAVTQQWVPECCRCNPDS